MIEFQNVFIKYVNDFFSLYDCNLKIEKNTILIEKNLCGSSAFMRIVSQIDKPQSGEVLIDNINIKDIRNKDLDVAYLPENPILFKQKSVEYNLSYPLKIRKIDKNTIKNKTNSLFSQYNLENFNKKVKKLNSSEQKIIALLRAAIREPKYILLENFFENFDENYLNLAVQILNDIKQKSIIIASQNSFEKFKFFKDFDQIEI